MDKDLHICFGLSCCSGTIDDPYGRLRSRVKQKSKVVPCFRALIFRKYISPAMSMG